MLSVIRRAVVLPEPSRDLEALPELIHAIAGRWEVIPVRPVFVFFPAGADSELEPSTRNVIDARGHLRLQRRVAVLHRGDEDAESDLRRISCESGEERPRLEAVSVGRSARAAEEMVAHPEGAESGLLRTPCQVADLRV